MGDWGTANPPPHSHDESMDSAPHVSVIQVVQVSWLRGTGCCKESIVRRVCAYYDMDGLKLAEVDGMVPE